MLRATLLAMNRSRRSFTTGLAALGAALVVGCVSPTLPLPPPETPIITQGSEPNRYVLTGGKGSALVDAFIIAINQSLSLSRDKRVSGTQADEEGRWRVEVYASPGDRIDITQERGDVRSTTLSIAIPR